MKHFISRLLFPLFAISYFILLPHAMSLDEDGISVQKDIRKPLSWSTHWVDSVFGSLTQEQRIAQLLMVRIHTDRDETYYQQQENLIRRYNVGGVAFFRGGPVRQVQITNRYQAASQTPLLVAMDAEWGPSMRLDSTMQFPRQMTLGAINDNNKIYQMGYEVARQLSRLGVHINFAPVVDVNNNPDNPVINFRSFGENRYDVALKGLAYMQGMQDHGIIACAKHFPGHGDTNIDSHYALPILNHQFQEIDSIHLYPFKRLIMSGLDAIMTAHLHIPVLDDRKNVASSLSHPIVTGLLQNQMGFQGLIITDALDMRGVSDYYSPGELEVQALMAGNDILLLPENVPAAIRAIKQAIDSGLIEEEYVNQKCKKILYYKQRSGLDQFRPISEKNLVEELNPPSARALIQSMAASAITLVKNESGLLPVKDVHGTGMAALSIGAAKGNHMHQTMLKYRNIPLYSIDKQHNAQQASYLKQQLAHTDTLIISIHNNSFFPSRQYGINKETVALISALSKEKTIILTIYANPYSLLFFEDFSDQLDAILVAYQDGKDYEESAAQIIFGGLPARGRLPVSAGNRFPVNTGLLTDAGFRVGFSEPETLGMSRQILKNIDSIAQLGIDSGAFPGCQIVLIKDGMVVYHNSFGSHTYQNGTQVQNSHLYDLASLTKIIATTAAIMHLSDQGKVNVDNRISNYLPWLTGTNKQDIRIRELMAHQARLKSWIPFFSETLDNGGLNPFFYTHRISEEHPIEVARNLYLQRYYRDSIFTRIAKSPLNNNRNYIYSDLGFILLAEIVEVVSGMPLDEYVDQHFFHPMGLSSLCFRPMKRFPANVIAPTEYDTLFRKQLVHGHVHDPAAAMLGGVSGHAGLFGNALDVAVMMQLFLNGGTYAGQQYIREETLREFTRVQFPGNSNRRGLGFDKPPLDNRNNGPVCSAASPQSFGHSGFTGTYAWADPKHGLVYVFLSNRVYPTANNPRLSRKNIRTNIHQTAYDAIFGGMTMP